VHRSPVFLGITELAFEFERETRVETITVADGGFREQQRCLQNSLGKLSDECRWRSEVGGCPEFRGTSVAAR